MKIDAKNLALENIDKINQFKFISKAFLTLALSLVTLTLIKAFEIIFALICMIFLLIFIRNQSSKKS